MSWDQIVAGRAPWLFEVSARRVAMAHSAACDIADLADEIAKSLRGTEETLARSLAVRIAQLGEVAMNALGTREADEGDLYFQLTRQARAWDDESQEVKSNG